MKYKYKQISAEIIADSINEYNDRLTTFIITIPRIVLSEFNTHRQLSKNSASSRAIPFKKMIEKVKNEPFMPIGFQKDHKGMQGTDYLKGNELKAAQNWWKACAMATAEQANQLHSKGVTKQICNRLLEPYMMHTIIVTASEWENFFALRHHEAAEIHIAKVAELMLNAYNNSIPKELKKGEWHIPFGDRFDDDRLKEACLKNGLRVEGIDVIKRKVSIARCARISYNNFEGKDDYSADIKLYNRLRSMGHMSPFEHVAYAMDGIRRTEGDGRGFCGNFRGWVQQRKTILNESKVDPRVKKFIPSHSKLNKIESVINKHDVD